ncbi:hypothetical protein C8T65DRAFT_772842 [Cerioporus squamosus]|nr:hypothetical protein C8T65DRAFT_772842 [Cerioporus squamosus]
MLVRKPPRVSHLRQVDALQPSVQSSSCRTGGVVAADLHATTGEQNVYGHQIGTHSVSPQPHQRLHGPFDYFGDFDAVLKVLKALGLHRANLLGPSLCRRCRLDSTNGSGHPRAIEFRKFLYHNTGRNMTRHFRNSTQVTTRRASRSKGLHPAYAICENDSRLARFAVRHLRN